jgi:hypothetical protein
MQARDRSKFKDEADAIKSMNEVGNSASFDVTSQLLTRQNGEKERCDEVRAFMRETEKKNVIK